MRKHAIFIIFSSKRGGMQIPLYISKTTHIHSKKGPQTTMAGRVGSYISGFVKFEIQIPNYMYMQVVKCLYQKVGHTAIYCVPYQLQVIS